MTDDVAARLADTLRHVLGRPDLVVTDGLRAVDVDGWDSVAHVELIYAIEDVFGVTFDSDGLLRHDDLGALRRDVERYLQQRTT